jgi:putative transposase
MKRTFKYRIYANKQTLEKAEQWLDLCRWLYNTALEQRILAYRQNRKSLSYYDQQNELPKLKHEMPEYKDIGSQILQDVLHRLDKTYKAFFRNKFGFPRFRGKNRYNSFTLTYQQGWKLQDKYLYISKLGVFKLKLSREIQGTIKTITIRKLLTNKWHVCFNCGNIPIKELPKSNKSVGLDVGISSFCVDSDGKQTSNPLYLRQAEAILRRKQRILSRRKKGSKHRAKARLLVAKAHEKIQNQRRDFLHKTANYYIENYDVIYIEDLNVKGMVQNHHLAKSINDSSWGAFANMLTYKAEGAGRELVKVPPQNTSQLCSNCGLKVEKNLAVRVHQCPYCGLVLDRDENAAKNINRLGRSLQPSTCRVAECVG